VRRESPTKDAGEPESLAEAVGAELQQILPFRARAMKTLTELGGYFVLAGRALVRAWRPPVDIRALIYQVESLGVRSLSIASFTAIFAGLVICLQFGFFLGRFGVAHTVGKVAVLTIFRELGPVLTALTVGSRVGSGIAAELGSMKVTEQLDAIRALGADPVKKLVSPRLWACIIVLPLLTVLADVMGMAAGAAVVNFEYHIPLVQFYESALDTVNLKDFFSGVGKAVVFGAIVGAVGCYQGFQVSGGTEGVGRATTETVAVSSVSVLVADFFLTKLLLLVLT
jgi:phospholipid/cholesterol/gamma-HCH transport system permease protein